MLISKLEISIGQLRMFPIKRDEEKLDEKVLAVLDPGLFLAVLDYGKFVLAG
jgi:hypothetical protein